MRAHDTASRKTDIGKPHSICHGSIRAFRWRARRQLFPALILGCGVLLSHQGFAFSLGESAPAPARPGVHSSGTQASDTQASGTQGATPPGSVIPLPGNGDDTVSYGTPSDDEPEDPPDDPDFEPSFITPAPALPVHYDLSTLPKPVRRMRQLIIDAAKSGDVENLRPLLGTGPTRTQLAIGAIEGDPIDYLRSVSGDGKGEEILAILLDVLDAGFSEIDPETSTDTYVWPYFFTRPIGSLTPVQRVELLRIVTAGDVDGMKVSGGYNFYRVGIAPDGQWIFFVAGD